MEDKKLPACPGRSPAVLELEPGVYHWCRCGLSKNQPFCDSSHQGTGIEPMELAITEPKKVALCICKTTGAPPLCDGNHRFVPAPPPEAA